MEEGACFIKIVDHSQKIKKLALFKQLVKIFVYIGEVLKDTLRMPFLVGLGLDEYG